MKFTMKTGALHMASVLLLTTGGVAQSHQVVTVQSQELRQGIRISGGKLVIDGETVLKRFSVLQSRFSFLFFYVPEQGLWIISAREFDGAVEAGSFRGSELAVELEGISFRVESSGPILGRGETPAWVKLDRSHTLEVESVLFGYGDREKDAYAWQNHLDSAR